MSNEQFITHWKNYIKAWLAKDMELADRLTDELISPDAVWHLPGVTGVEPGSAGQKKFAREAIANNPDFHIEIDEYLSAGDKIVERGAMYTNNPTSGEVETTAFLEIDRLVDGKVAEAWSLLAPGKWDETVFAPASDAAGSAKEFFPKYLASVDTWNKKDVNRLDQLTDEIMLVNAVGHWPGGEPQQGTAGQKAFAHEMIANNPDLHITIEDLLADGDKMILRASALLNNPTTGKVENHVYLEIDLIIGGKIAESWTMSAPGVW